MTRARPRTRHAMAYVTAPDRATARKIARTVVERRLAACANLWPVESMYRWEGGFEDSREFVIVFKTRQALLGRLISEVRRNHPYEVPCIVSYSMGPALPVYLEWVDAETAQK
jgi:periplasmic divalent cation tolerance protein